MIATETIVPNRKLKIKFSTKSIEVNPGTRYEFGQKVSHIDDSGHGILNDKSSVPGSNKRGSPGSYEDQKEKGQKMDRKASQQCVTILKSLTTHPYGWVFSKPVDPVALNIPDYFSIISEPMDLGTIKNKLEKNMYSGIEEFAADVRLTFSNAMTYNPASNDVHLMAKELNKSFESRWKDLDKKWKCEDDHGKSMPGATKETSRKRCIRVPPPQKDTSPKKRLLSEQKGIQRSSLVPARDAKVEVPKSSQIPCKLIIKNLHKGSKDHSEGGHPSVSVKACRLLGPVTHKCSVCGDTCHCVIPSDLSCGSSGSEGRDLHGADALKLDFRAKCTPLQWKSDPDSDGAVSALDSERICSGSLLTSPSTDTSSGEVWSSPIIDVHLSPKKALRAAMLKSRFADTILKAQQKTLLDHGDKADHVRMQQEKERLERLQREERARIEAQIKAAEAAARKRAEEELKQQREKEREAARVAIQKMERTVEIEHNLEILKELEMLSGCTLSYEVLRGNDGSRDAMETVDKSERENPLERLGLFIKDEVMADEDEELLNGNWEEGEIFS